MNDTDEKTALIHTNLEAVQNRIAAAANRSHRDPADITIIAVTKLVSLEMVRAGYHAGLIYFGENYAEQAVEKIQSLKHAPGIEWHMIGHIQSRKAKMVAEYFDYVHSVDRMKIARYLDQYSKELNRIMPILLEVNVSGEDSKFGWTAYSETHWENLVKQFRQIAEMQNLEIRGLMSMPPLSEDPEKTRPVYQKLVRLQQFLKNALPDVNWKELSIGTSFDFEVAIEEGATIIRVGRAIFG